MLKRLSNLFSVKITAAWMLLVTGHAHAVVVPNPQFTSRAVLQRDTEVPVWSTADNGEKITVTFAGQSITTTASDGEWLVRLKPKKANTTPQILTISGTNTITLNDILIGGVWICSGRSNMELPVAKSTNGRAVAAKINEPLIRLFEVATAQSPTPLQTVKSSWQRCDSRNAAAFSPVGYYFAHALQKALNVPVGLIGSYAKLFPTLITDWRAAWNRGDFPFLFVQLPPFNAIPPELREIQFNTWKNTPNTGMIVITDHGSATNIHPPEKEPVGRRPALAARAIACQENITWSGPVFQSTTLKDAKAIIHFDSIGTGLQEETVLKGFTIAGADGKFVPADSSVRGDTVEVSNPTVIQPTAVRYGWANVPEVNLFNKEGLPAVPFRADLSEIHN